MNILITGGDGMLGRTLQDTLIGHTLSTPAFPAFDITSEDSVRTAFTVSRPEVVIHCAAMTNVDLCETEEKQAFAVNGAGTGTIAKACTEYGARLIAISTDYVFDGSLGRPYTESDPTNPKTVYGRSKLAGEEAVRATCANHAILRIAWLYGGAGPSFVHTMIRLGEQGGDPLKVVDDQIGNPTSTQAVAEVILELLDTDLTGTFHATCDGETTWYGLTRKIFELKGITRDILPCTTDEFPRPAPRPANSRLENRALATHGLSPVPDWVDALAQFLG